MCFSSLTTLPNVAAASHASVVGSVDGYAELPSGNMTPLASERSDELFERAEQLEKSWGGETEQIKLGDLMDIFLTAVIRTCPALVKFEVDTWRLPLDEEPLLRVQSLAVSRVAPPLDECSLAIDLSSIPHLRLVRQLAKNSPHLSRLDISFEELAVPPSDPTLRTLFLGLSSFKQLRILAMRKFPGLLVESISLQSPLTTLILDLLPGYVTVTGLSHCLEPVHTTLRALEVKGDVGRPPAPNQAPFSVLDFLLLQHLSTSTLHTPLLDSAYFTCNSLQLLQTEDWDGLVTYDLQNFFESFSCLRQVRGKGRRVWRAAGERRDDYWW